MKKIALLSSLLFISLTGCKTLVDKTINLANSLNKFNEANVDKQFNPQNFGQRIRVIKITAADCDTRGNCYKQDEIKLPASPKYPRGVTRSSVLQTISFDYDDQGQLISKKSVYLDSLSRDYINEHDIKYVYDRNAGTVLAQESAKHHSNTRITKPSFLFHFENGFPYKIVNQSTGELHKELTHTRSGLEYERDYDRSKVYQYKYQKGRVSEVEVKDLRKKDINEQGLVMALGPVSITGKEDNIILANQEITIPSYSPMNIKYSSPVGSPLRPVSTRYQGVGLSQMKHDIKGFIKSYSNPRYKYHDMGFRAVIVEFAYEKGRGNASFLENSTKDTQTNLDEVLSFIYWK